MFTVYTKDNCSYCEMAKALLLQKGIPFQALKLGQDITREELLAQIPNARTMPQILKDGEPIGGFSELRLMLN